MNRISSALLLLPFVLCGACAQRGLYEWEHYEEGVYKFYKNPESQAEFAASLEEMIDRARQKGEKTPPGVAAQYGFLQYKAGHLEDAIAYFDLERRNWSESEVLMAKLIGRIEDEKAGGEEEPHAVPAEDALAPTTSVVGASGPNGDRP